MESIAPSQTTISRPWLTLARVGWVIFTVTAISLWVIGTIELAGQPPASCVDGSCDPFELTAEDLGVAVELGLSPEFLLGFWNLGAIIMAVMVFGIAIFIFVRKSDDWMALLVSFSLIFLGSVFFTESDDAVVRARSDLAPLVELLTAIGLTAFVFLLFTFPNGQFVPTGRAYKIVILGLILVSFPLVSTVNRANSIGTAILMLTIPIGLGSQVYRYRTVSDGIQRQQTKWVVVGLIGSFAVMLAWILTAIFLPPEDPSRVRLIFLIITRSLSAFLIVFLPITIVFSMTRYRLWDVDVLIRRTLVYGTLITSLILLYFVIVTLFQTLLLSITGQQSPVVIVISTLIVAALFNRLLLYITNAVDRRFYRRRYDAEKTLVDFSMTVREEVDLENLSIALLNVVSDTMQPKSVSMWLKKAPHP